MNTGAPRVGLTFPVVYQTEFLSLALEAFVLDNHMLEDSPLALIDNGSTEDVRGVYEKYECYFGRKCYIRYDVNEGVSKAWNDGLRWLFDTAECNAVLVCNTDIVFGPNVARDCYCALENSGAYVVYPSTYRKGGALPEDFDGHAIEVGMKYAPGDTCDTNGFAGWCFMVGRRAWEDVGPFDEQFRFWFQDTDYHWRLVNGKDSGDGPVVRAPNPALEVRSCIVHHYESRTIASLPGQFNYRGPDTDRVSWREQDQKAFEQKWQIIYRQ